MIIIKEVILLFCILFFDDVDGKKHHKEQILNVKISFLCNDNASERFISDRLSPMLDHITECVNLEIYPLYIPEPPRYLYDPNVDLVYQCAYVNYKNCPHMLGIFYQCVLMHGETWHGCQQCIDQIFANFGVDGVRSCILSLYQRDPDTAITQLTVELNGVTSPEALTDFRNVVCNKLKEVNEKLYKKCVCCSPP